MTKHNTLIGIGFAVLATLIWSGNFIVARGVTKDIPPISLAFYRWLIATILLLPFVLKYIIPERALVKHHLIYLLAAAVTGISMFNTFVYIGGHYSDAINLALIGTTSSPIISVILAAIFLKERISLLRIIGMIISLAGVLFLLSKGSWQNLYQFSFSAGDWWVLAAAISFAIYNTLVKKKPVTMNSLHFLWFLFFAGTVILLPFYLWEYRTVGGFEPNIKNLSVILYLTLGASVICFIIWNKAIARIGSARTALFGNLIPVFSTIEAVLILHEKVNFVQLLSFALVILGLFIANLQRSPAMGKVLTHS